LFTDIEGSTRLVKALRERYPPVLADHRRLVRAAVAAHDGHEVDTQGDAFFVAFAGAKQAVLCALAIQRALDAHEWPTDGRVRVRIGIHTGHAVPAEGAYTGLAVHRAARISASARGGQVLISQATASIIEDEEETDPGFTLVDLGEQKLKDLDRPVRLFQLAAPGLDPPPALDAPGGPAAEPRLERAVSLRDPSPELRGPAAAAAAPTSVRARHNLPAPLTSFLGRDHDLAELERLLGQVRLVTVTGTGGAGKTRLAVEAAARVMGRFGDGVWLAELAGIADPGLVATAVMEALGVRQEAGVPVLEALRYRLRSAQVLLVLDNCEHLLDASAQLAGVLLRGSPGLRVLATSREPLGIAGEVVYPVRPLPVSVEHAGADTAAGAPAVRLFLDRGSAARGGVTAGVAPVAVAERICRKLDGLPLAIELAAARLGTLSAGEIEARLADRFAFLARRRPGAEPRHQALQAAIDWSYQLLPAEERRVFSDLSVFAGTFGLAQAAAVCGTDEVEVLEVIDQLAAKSLLVAEPAEDGTRYRLLDTIRHYAADRLAEAGCSEAARRRHALAFLSLAEHERGPAVLSRNHDNFRAALDWSLSTEDQTGPRLVLALGGFWLARGLLQEGRDWLERALAQRSADQRMRADMLRLLGAVLYEAGDLNRAEAVLSEGLQVATIAKAPALQARIRFLLAEFSDTGLTELAAECEAAIAVLESEGDLEGLAEAWMEAGNLRWSLGDIAAGEEALERAIAYARQSGHHRAQMRASHWLAVTFHVLPIPVDAGIARAEQLLQEASGDPWAEADLLKPLCVLYAYAGRAADARAALARTRSIFASFGAEYALAESAIPAGVMELVIGDPAAAERYLREGYQAFRAMGERGYPVPIAAHLAEALYVQGRFDEALQMTQEVQAAAALDVPENQIRWRATRAKLLARRGQSSVAHQLIAEAETLVSRTSNVLLTAEILVAKAEVDRLTRAPDQAVTHLGAALQIYEDRRATSLAEHVRTALASLATGSDTKPV
jgi:predicted ATPase/class 3 adenylate cyclase